MTDTITLDCDDRPTIRPGDTLKIFPDYGRPYTLDVREVAGDDVIGASTGTDLWGVPRKSHKRLSADELTGWYVRGDVLINPRDPPEARL